MDSHKPNPVNPIAFALGLVFFGAGLFFMLFSLDIRSEFMAHMAQKHDLDTRCAKKSNEESKIKALNQKTITDAQAKLSAEKDKLDDCTQTFQAATQDYFDNEVQLSRLRSSVDFSNKTIESLQAQAEGKPNAAFSNCVHLNPMDQAMNPIASQWEKTILSRHPEWAGDGGLGLSSICTLIDERTVVSLEAPKGKNTHVMLFAKNGDFVAETLNDAFDTSYYDRELKTNPRIVDYNSLYDELLIKSTPSGNRAKTDPDFTEWTINLTPGIYGTDANTLSYVVMSRTCEKEKH